MAVKINAGRNNLYREYPYPKNPAQFPVPHTIFTDASGKEIDRIVGYLGPAQFKEKMQTILADYVN